MPIMKAINQKNYFSIKIKILLRRFGQERARNGKDLPFPSTNVEASLVVEKWTTKVAASGKKMLLACTE